MLSPRHRGRPCHRPPRCGGGTIGGATPPVATRPPLPCQGKGRGLGLNYRPEGWSILAQPSIAAIHQCEAPLLLRPNHPIPPPTASAFPPALQYEAGPFAHQGQAVTAWCARRLSRRAGDGDRLR